MLSEKFKCPLRLLDIQSNATQGYSIPTPKDRSTLKISTYDIRIYRLGGSYDEIIS